MRIVALMLVRNEEWIIESSLRAVLDWCDAVALMDHASTDRTLEIVQRIAGESPSDRIALYHWPDASRWDEMTQRQRLLDFGRALGGTHFAMIDADEIVTANNVASMRPWVESLAPGQVLELPMIPVWDGLEQYRHDDSVWSRSRLSVAFADKVGMGWAPRGIEQYHHHNRVPHGETGRATPPDVAGGAMHLQWADWERVVAKHRRYKLLERLRYPAYPVREIDAKYNQAVCEREVKREPIPEAWWIGIRRDLIALGGPYWYDDDSRGIMKQKTLEYFDGLDLFGWKP